MSANERVTCRTPTPSKQPTHIDRWRFDTVRRAILETIPRRAEVPFAELPAKVEAALSAEERDRLGSVSWYTTVVKLEMEVAGELERVAGASPQRLRRGPAGPPKVAEPVLISTRARRPRHRLSGAHGRSTQNRLEPSTSTASARTSTRSAS